MGRIWSMHYSKHHSNQISYDICSLICYLIQAEASMKIGNRKAIIASMLDEAGIPIGQFDECKTERKPEK